MGADHYYMDLKMRVIPYDHVLPLESGQFGLIASFDAFEAGQGINLGVFMIIKHQLKSNGS